MAEELSYAFNVVLDREVSQRIKLIQQKLRARFSEQRNYDPSPHLSIHQKHLELSKSDEFVGALVDEFQNESIWKLEFNYFSIADSISDSPSESLNSYIFLNLDTQSKQILFDLNSRAIDVTRNITSELGTASKYPYEPHISILKVKREEVAEAFKIVLENFLEVKMEVTKYEITRQQRDPNGFSIFPVIGEINLK